jgi:hypothetical protein
MKDAVLSGVATVGGKPVSLTVMDFFFMGGSMGSVVGEKVARSIETALAPLSVVARVDPATIEDYPTGERIATEAFNLTFFTTAGRFDFDAASATRDQPSGGVKLKFEEIPATTRDALLWVVVRDLRGGEAVAGPYRVGVAQP